jgi:hypothetical protein
MLSVMAEYRAVQVAHEERCELYDSLSAFYSARGNRNAALLMSLESLSSQRWLGEWVRRLSPEGYKNALLALARSNHDIEAGADVYAALVKYMRYDDEGCRGVIDEALKAFPNSVHRAFFESVKAELGRGMVRATLVGGSYDPVRVALEHKGVDGCRISFYHHGKKRIEAVRDLKFNAADDGAIDTVLFVLSPGNYRMTLEYGGVSDTAYVDGVTSMRIVATSFPGFKNIMTVVDGNTGRPLKDVSLSVRNRKGELKGELVTDDRGQAFVLCKEYGMKVSADAGGFDKAEIGYLTQWGMMEDAEEETKYSLFADRAVYRPGQKVSVGVLAYRQDGDKTVALRNHDVTLVLYDANGKEVEKTVVKTNTMGSGAADFILPKDCTPGAYAVRVDGRHNLALRVEEYKRPTYAVEMSLDQDSYALGDSVAVCGKAMTFSGVPVQSASVKYRVEYRNMGFWHRYNASWNMAASGMLETDGEGRFALPVYLDPNTLHKDHLLLEYRVTTDVVSGAGETQQGECRLVVSPNSFGLWAEVPSVVVAGSDASMCVKAVNLAGKEIEQECEYTIHRRGRNAKVVHRGRTAGAVVLPEGLAPGDYRIEFAAIDKVRDFATGVERDDTVRTEAGFTLFDPHARTMDVADNFIYATSESISEEQPVEVYFVPKHKGVTLYWMLVAGDSLLEKGMRRVDDEVQRFSIEYRKEYGDGVTLKLFYVKDFKLYSCEKSITLIKSDKKLILKWKTFRDKLVSGQREMWSLSIRDSEGHPVDAELLATMYDASLDRICPHGWVFEVDFVRRVAPVGVVGSGLSYGDCSLMTAIPKFDIRSRRFNRLVDFGGGVVFNEVMVMNASPMKSRALKFADSVSGLDEVAEEALSFEQGTGDVRSLRSDFAETALFYPHIRTNKKGEASIDFTLPESMTEWRFLGLAHTEDMKHGMIEGRAVASKEFMVQPNVPRFVRVGDKASLASSIVNRTDVAVSGVVVMTLLDYETEKVLMREEQSFSVGGGQTVVVDFAFEPTDEYPMLVCQVEAYSKEFSDGERHLLPVLSDKQQVVTTIPFFLDGKEGMALDISGIFNDGSITASGRKLKVECVENPAWMAVDALRTVAVPETDNAVSVSAAHYANFVAGHIGDKLGGLFDKDSVEILVRQSAAKLRKLQNEDGSWSWFAGMSGNAHITSLVVEHIAEAERLVGKNSLMHDDMLRGLEWLDREELKRYERMKETGGEIGVLPESVLRYLYVSLLVVRDVDSAVVAMREEYLGSAEKMVAGLTIYGRANIACVLACSGRNEAAKEFVESLREHTVSKREMGRYYDSDKALYSWCDYRMPTHLAAMKAMRQQGEVFADTQKYLNEMTLWIMQQKRSQAWDSPINTVGAINELLADNMLEHREIRSHEYYVDKAWVRKNEVVECAQGVNELQVVPTDDNAGVSWGAVYGICDEHIDRIESSSTDAISVSRKMYVERLEGGSVVWIEVAEGCSLKVGDKVRIRYTLTTDRDMDFVEVNSQHPACFEPVEQLSGYKWLGTLGAYLAQHDASVDFYFDKLHKGSVTFDQIMYVGREGVYASGIVVAKCAYSPEFSARTGSRKIVVE